jgi:hypothetical protein
MVRVGSAPLASSAGQTLKTALSRRRSDGILSLDLLGGRFD